MRQKCPIKPRFMQALGVVVAVGFMVACGEFTGSSPEGPSLAQQAADVEVALSQEGDYDAWLLQVAKRVPGFAGVYLDGDGNLEIALTDLSRESLARQAIAPLRADRPGIGDGRAVLVEFNFEELATWRDRVVGGIDNLDGLVFLDVNEGLNRLVLGVTTPEKGLSITRELASLGIPESATIVTAVGVLQSQSHTLNSHLDTAQGGLQVFRTLIDDCTLGFNGIYQGQRIFTTASHCSSTLAGFDPVDRWGQPTLAYPIGYEYADPFWRYYPACPGWFRCRESDVTLGRYDPGVDAEVGVIARPIGEGSRVIDHSQPKYFVTGGWWWPQQGQGVRMIGQTSGQQTGDITNTCVLVPESSNWFTCQYLADYESRGGDSGAPILILAADSSHVEIAGTHKGETTTSLAVFSPWQGIQGDFGFIETEYDPVVDPPPPFTLTVTIEGPSQVKPNELCTWYSTVSGGTPPYQYQWYRPPASPIPGATGPEVTLNTGTSNFQLRLVVLDPPSGSGADTVSVTVTAGAMQCFI